MSEQPHFFDQHALVHRLSAGLNKRRQETVFLLGAGLSTPTSACARGVPGTEDLIQLIRNEFCGNSLRLEEFDRTIGLAGGKRYQAAFLFLQGHLGQETANEIVKRAVLGARLNESVSERTGLDLQMASDEDLRPMDLDSQWSLNPGTTSVGRLVAEYSEIFGRLLLTTNFDPLIECAIRRAGGQCYRTVLQADGDWSNTDAAGCHVVHLHGYWYGSDTLHTGRQLQQSRPRLKASLASLLRNRLVLICGYGGWDDVFADALMEVVGDDAAKPDILWAFHSEKPVIADPLASRIGPGLDRGRISLYCGIDCNFLFPILYDEWQILEPHTYSPATTQTNAVHVSLDLRREVELLRPQNAILEGDDEDRPPLVAFCVGRDVELLGLKESSARVAFITGIGGQGKSTVAAQYFADVQHGHQYSYLVWRDCKEESERFENQLASVAEKLSYGKISGQDLAKQDATSIVQLVMSLMADFPLLFVFDNADHYVNLDSRHMTATADLFIQALVSSQSRSRLVLTCRPSVQYDHPDILQFNLQGLSEAATQRLFSERGANCTNSEIADAHQLTNGHAFWLDLLCIQVTKNPGTTLRQLVERLRAEQGPLPERTLSSIWMTLKDREKLVLRSMAETVRPATETEITEYLKRHRPYQKVIKALKTLKAMNLVVVKRRQSADDVLELHPLVRQFVRQSFSRVDRIGFIDDIIKWYQRFMGSHSSELEKSPGLTILQYWTQAAELDIAAGKLGLALAALEEVADAFSASGYSREFTRVVQLLLASMDWVTEHGKYKHFDRVFSTYIETLAQVGEYGEIDALLEKYELTVAERDSRYILYCYMKCHSKWVRGDFADAVKWGMKGRAIKDVSDVDTYTQIDHDLALAQRDAGQPEIALPFFLSGRDLTLVTDPEELDESKGGAYYGNIGRCLHYMGQINLALICYQKSALLIEKDRHKHVMNRGFIRRWIGELLIGREQYKLAANFLEAARLKWEQVSPPRAFQVSMLQERFKEKLPLLNDSSPDEIEGKCRDWIVGRYMDIAAD